MGWYSFLSAVCVICSFGWVSGSDAVDHGVHLLDLPIPGRPLVSSVLPSVGGSINANPIEWVFFTVVIVPLFSCDSTLKTAVIFNEALRRMNPTVDSIRSRPLRLDSDVCIDGECFCDDRKREAGGGNSLRVMEIETVCSSEAIQLPPDTEFPFEYDTRDRASPLSAFSSVKGRML
jgi:hypothetical protein